MKVLFLTREFPYPPRDGNLLPIYHFLRCLAPRHAITLLTLRPDDDALWEAGRRELEGWGVRIEALRPTPRGRLGRALACLLDGRWWVNRFYEPQLARACAARLAGEDWDLLHAEGILSAQHLPFPARGQGPTRPPRVLVARDCLSLAHRRAAEATGDRRERLQAHKIAWMERALYGQSDCVMAIGEVDRAAMRELAPGARFELLPNGIDLATFYPQPDREQAGVVMFTGAMDFPPNTDAVLHFVRAIWPGVRAARPGARFVVAGRRVPPQIAALHGQDGIEIRGEVESMAATLAEAAVVVSPLRWGTGMKNKVLEAAAMGRAMVISPVSLEGIALQPGIDLSVAGDDAAFAREVAELLGDDPRRGAMGRRARAAVEGEYSWDAMAQRLARVYEELAGNAGAPGPTGA